MSKLLRVATLAIALGALALPVVAKDEPAAGADPVVAKINGDVITRSEIVRELQSLGATASQIPTSKLYPQLLEKAIVTKLLATKGYADKLEKDPEVKVRLKDAEAQLVADAYIRKTIMAKITDEKLKKRYDELSEKFKPEDEVRARHILVKTEAEANELLKKVKGGEDFAKVAGEKSIDAGSAQQGGDLGYFNKSTMVKPFTDAAFSMKNGEISEKPVKSDFGYHIIKVEDRRKSSAPPFAEVKDELTNRMGQEMAAEFIKEMKSKAKIERFDVNGNPLKVKEDKEDKKEADKK